MLFDRNGQPESRNKLTDKSPIWGLETGKGGRTKFGRGTDINNLVNH